MPLSGAVLVVSFASLRLLGGGNWSVVRSSLLKIAENFELRFCKSGVFTLHIPFQSSALQNHRASHNPKSIMNAPTRSPRQHGFALVVTLSLMILLTVIAVGLLSLSSITLRATGQGEAMATARSNAHLALMLALGDLQKTLGPDRAVTATSEILGTPTSNVSKPNTAGVWGSWWDFDPNSSPPPDYVAQKKDRAADANGKFRRWLVSSADAAAPESRDFVTTAWTGKTVELVGNGSLGANATAAAKATAGLVPVSKNGKTQGAYAWHVADESVKARINVYRDPSQNGTLAQKRALLAGHRPDPSVMRGADGATPSYLPTDLSAAEFALAKEKSGKVIDLNQVELLDQAKGKVKQFRNDVTPYSLGVIADVRRGGLKEDLSSIFEMSTATGAMSLPAAFTGSTNQKLYLSTTPTHTGVSDPYWSNLWGYYNFFRKITTPDTKPTLVLPAPANSLTADLTPRTYYPSPVIAKVDTIFSLVSRPVSDVFWLDKTGGNNGAKSAYDYFVDLIFTPVVTLHNPYNVTISFHSMKVKFVNVPIAFNFMFQAGGAGPFVSQSVIPGTFESLSGMGGADHRGDKTFEMQIANWTDTSPLTPTSAISGPIVMKPGQTLICGPSLDPSKSFKSDAGAGSDTTAFDWENRLTKAIKAKPEFTPGLGFETCGVTVSHIRNPAPLAPGGSGPGWCTFFFLRDTAAQPKDSTTTATDRFYLEFKAQRPSWYSTDSSTSPVETSSSSFLVTAQLQATSGGTPVNCAKVDFNYKDDASLKSLFNNRVYRYPPTGSKTGFETSVKGGETYGRQASSLHPFAVFSAYARTTNGGVYETGSRTKTLADTPQINLLKDGRLAGKPFLFHTPTQAVVTMALATGKPGAQPYELNLQPFLNPGNYQDYMDVSADNRVPAITANTKDRGIKSGSYLEIPTGPMQTIADFRRSNALASSYLPHFAQPIGNSLLHPLMSANKSMESNSAVSATALLDHSVLANHALYDRFYFSTFATRGIEKPDRVFEQFMDGTTPLASQSFQPYLPAGYIKSKAMDALFTSGKPKDKAYQTAAEYQMVRGPFNVNSTSVQAWKAVLAAMNKSLVATLWSKNVALEVKATPGIPIFAMSLLNGGRTGAPLDSTKIDDAKTNDWNGYRELDDIQLTTLATKIVEQVRLRGPFLSMSEFVNRQVGPESDLSLSGALEKAITDSEINKDAFNSVVTPLTTADFSNVALYNYKTPAATIGNPAAGAPGWISQGDLLRILEPAATVRSDTFVIRVCGEAQDASGKVTARAFAEAVVQRVPEYVDPVDRPSLNAYDITVPAAVPSTAAAANKTFGRRMNVVSFRWLASNEI